MAGAGIKSKILDTKIFGLLIGLFIFFFFVFILFTTKIFQNSDKAVLDFNFRLKGRASASAIKEGVTQISYMKNVSRDILLLGIDKLSLNKFGKWPFARAVEANLVNSFARVQDSRSRERGLFLDINFIERDLKNPENDSLMISSLENNRRVFLEAFYHPIDFAKGLDEEHVERQKTLFENAGMITSNQIKGDWKELLEWRSVEAPLKPYGRAAYQYGNVSTLPDTDKVYRRQAIISRFSIELEEIYLKDLKVGYTVDEANLERLGWKDFSGQVHNIQLPLTEEGLDLLEREMERYAPQKDLDTDGDGHIDDSQFIIRRYRDYIIPAIPLVLALEYFNVSLSEIEILVGKGVLIKNPQLYNHRTREWGPFWEKPETYEYHPYFRTNQFIEEVWNKLTSVEDKQFISENLKRNSVFDVYTVKEELFQDGYEEDLLHLLRILNKTGYTGIKKIKEGIPKKELLIPLDSLGRMTINFMGPRTTADSLYPTFEVKSFSDYVNDPGTDPEKWPKTKGVEGKLIIVGMFATGLADEKPTPFGLMFGPELMANSLNTIIMDNFLTEAPLWINISILLFMITLACVISTRMKTAVSFVASFVVILAYLVVMNLFFDHRNYILPVVAPVTGVLLSFVAIVVYRVMTEEKEKKKIKNMFGKYVSPTVVDKILQNPPELGGVDKEITVFFSDIRGFTTLSERMTPQALVNHLNEYLTAMTDIILEYGGTLDKYVGDEIMCFWGAPLPQEDHAYLACKCALKQMEALNNLNAHWPEEKKIDIGIGLNSGIMTVGNMGSMGRMNYTLMGDNVNLGARLEGTNKQYFTNVIISEYTYGLVKERVVVRELDNIRVKGKNKPVLIYELIDVLD